MAFANKEAELAYRRKWYAENRGSVRAEQAAYREANLSKKRATDAAYRRNNRDALLAKGKAYRESDAGRQWIREYQAEYYARPDKRMRLLVLCAFKRAARKGMAYDEGLLPALEESPPRQCGCCGKALDYRMGKGRNVRDDSPSLDRFDNAQGYTLANVRVICMRCNDVKGSATLVEIETVAAYMNASGCAVRAPGKAAA